MRVSIGSLRGQSTCLLWHLRLAQDSSKLNCLSIQETSFQQITSFLKDFSYEKVDPNDGCNGPVTHLHLPSVLFSCTILLCSEVTRSRASCRAFRAMRCNGRQQHSVHISTRSTQLWASQSPSATKMKLHFFSRRARVAWRGASESPPRQKSTKQLSLC